MWQHIAARFLSLQKEKVSDGYDQTFQTQIIKTFIHNVCDFVGTVNIYDDLIF
jgi:hypothetical protein